MSKELAKHRKIQKASTIDTVLSLAVKGSKASMAIWLIAYDVMFGILMGLVRLVFSKKMFYQLLELIGLMFIAFVLVFILVHIIPGSTAKLANAALPVEQQRALIAQYGLDQPLATQFFLYVSGIFTRLDFGISLSVRTNDLVTNILGEKIILSLIIGSIALTFSVLIGYFFGSLIGLNGKNLFGGLGNISISFLLALPAYIVAVFIIGVAVAARAANLILFNYNRFETWILPIITLAIPQTATVANLVASEIIVQSQEQYVKFARAKGLGV